MIELKHLFAYPGPNCEIPLNLCDSQPCSYGGKCNQVNADSYTCSWYFEK